MIRHRTIRAVRVIHGDNAVAELKQPFGPLAQDGQQVIHGDNAVAELKLLGSVDRAGLRP